MKFPRVGYRIRNLIIRLETWKKPNDDIERLEEFFDALSAVAVTTMLIRRNPFDRLVQEEVIAMTHNNDEQASETENTGTVLRSQEHTAQPPETSDPPPSLPTVAEAETVPIDNRVPTVTDTDLLVDGETDD